eukprot:2103446-Pyramimonas_sp.AAC.1
MEEEEVVEVGDWVGARLGPARAQPRVRGGTRATATSNDRISTMPRAPCSSRSTRNQIRQWLV